MNPHSTPKDRIGPRPHGRESWGNGSDWRAAAKVVMKNGERLLRPCR